MNNETEALGLLKEFISFRSVSSKDDHKKDISACAAWLSSLLKKAGFENVSVYDRGMHPVVFAERIESKNFPTILFYGHYDVQPEDPVELWRSHPYKAVIKGNYIYGRGSSDDKGQLLTHIVAVKELLRSSQRLNANIKFLIEGEEEIGSPHLEQFLVKNRKLMAADVAVVSDMKIIAPSKPALTYALRGSVNFELTLTGQPKELHSGTFGGAIYNPLQALTEMIAKIHNKEMMVDIPGFYDGVDLVNNFSPDRSHSKTITDENILKDASATYAWGNKKFSLYEKTTSLPSFNICGLEGGYNKQGVKSIIPSVAKAKFNVRIVPGQNPSDIANKITTFFKKITPEHFNVRINFLMKSPAIEQAMNSKFLKLAHQSYKEGFGVAPSFLKSGGSIPVVELLMQKLNIPVLMMGFALGDDDMHAVNEKFYLPNFFNGIKTIKSFIRNVSLINTKKSYEKSYN